MGKLLPGGQVVRRLTLDEEIEGSNPSRAAKRKQPMYWLFSFVLFREDSKPESKVAGSKFALQAFSGSVC